MADHPPRRRRADRRHYAALTGGWTGAAAVLASLAAGRDRPAPRAIDVPVLALATFALARTVSRESVEEWLRAPFLDELPDGRTRPRGEGMRYVVGELLSCTRCTGTWAALATTAAWTLTPRAGRPVVSALALTGANDFLQAGFARATADPAPPPVHNGRPAEAVHRP